jgi:SAM-dependent methyltransferase
MDGFRPDTYGDAFADVYDEWYGGITDADATARFVDNRCPAGPVIELGVGDGRIARPLARLGRTVIGVDASMPMLERCRDAHAEAMPGTVRCVRADLAALPIAGAVAGALCAFNTLFNLPTIDAQRALVASVADVLTPGGAFVVEAITGAGLAGSDRQSVGISRMSVDRLVLSATLVDPDAQTIAGQHVDITEAGIRLRPWLLRWTTPDQLDALADEVGMMCTERYAGWNGEPFEADAEVHVSVYRTSGRPRSASPSGTA